MTDTERIAFLSKAVAKSTIIISRSRLSECQPDEILIESFDGIEVTGKDLASAIDALAAVMERRAS